MEIKWAISQTKAVYIYKSTAEEGGGLDAAVERNASSSSCVDY